MQQVLKKEDLVLNKCTDNINVPVYSDFSFYEIKQENVMSFVRVVTQILHNFVKLSKKCKAFLLQ